MTRAIVFGIGVAQTAVAEDAMALAEQALRAGNAEDAAVVAIATIFGRAEHPAVTALAGYFAAPVFVFDAAMLEAETPRLKNPSTALFAQIGCHGVAEAAALAAAGPKALLLVEKMKRGGVTIAIAGDTLDF